MDQFVVLGSLAERLHQEFTHWFYLLLPLFFGLALVLDWFRNPMGSPDFLDTLKRTIIATLLVAGFPEISNLILTLTSQIADKIDDLSGLDTLIRMAQEKTKSYTLTPMSLVLGFNDMMIAVLSFASYIVLYLARFISVALFHFKWIFLTILSPLLMLFHVFRGSTMVTLNLFKSLIEAASYKIVWATLSAMLTALPFGNTYSADGNYVMVIVLNFVIAFAMLGTPLIVRSLIGAGLSQMSQNLGMAAFRAAVNTATQLEPPFQLGKLATNPFSNANSWSTPRASDLSPRSVTSQNFGPQLPQHSTQALPYQPRLQLPPPPQY